MNASPTHGCFPNPPQVCTRSVKQRQVLLNFDLERLTLEQFVLCCFPPAVCSTVVVGSWILMFQVSPSGTCLWKCTLGGHGGGEIGGTCEEKRKGARGSLTETLRGRKGDHRVSSFPPAQSKPLTLALASQAHKHITGTSEIEGASVWVFLEHGELLVRHQKPLERPGGEGGL